MVFKHLFTPLQIGQMTVRNRIVLPPHGVFFAAGYGSNTERVADYHIERAKGGVGLIVMSNFIVPPSYKKYGSWGGALELTQLGGLDSANDEQLLPTYSRLIDGVHEHGAKFISQLNAGGRQFFGPGTLNYNMPLLAPSPIACPKTKQIPKEMEVEDIAEHVETYINAAINMSKAGADGVEVFAAQGYLLHEFLSPVSNHRTDAYGGTLENRMRFLVEALKGIRQVMGSKFVLGVRMNGSDFEPTGIDLSMAREIAVRLAAQGLVDYLNISGMTYLQYPGWIADMTAPEAQFADMSKDIRSAVPGIPVCVVSRVGSPELAESVLAEGKADLVGMCRALISDPELPNKALRGDLEDIRACTYSNQSCLMGVTSGKGVACLHNVAVGREAQLGMGTMRPAKKQKRVVVVGGGPAGMAAARIASERGHHVTLLEKAAELGGQNRMTAKMVTRKNFIEVTRWQSHRLTRMKADVRLGFTATREAILALQPDVVIVATGSKPQKTGLSSYRPAILAIPGIDQKNVLTVWDVFKQPEAIGRNVVLIDEDPHYSGIYVAEHLADKGHSVEIVTSHFFAGRDLGVDHAREVYKRLGEKGVKVRSSLFLNAVSGEEVELEDKYSGEVTRISGVNTVVLAMGNVAENDLYRDLKGEVEEVYAIGDAIAPRRIDDAVQDGERIGWMV